MPNKQPIPDVAALVAAAQQGDTEAFGKVYDALVKPVYRYIYYRVDPQIAEDLTEEVFLKAWQKLGTYKKTKFPFSSWIFRIAHNLVCDYYRKDKPTMEISDQLADPVDDRAPDQQAEIKLTQVRLRSAISKLPESHQQIIILKYINELENPEIAQATGKSEGAIRVMQSRALKQLRGILEQEENGR